MPKIKKLKENGSTIYPATIPEGVVDTNGFTLAELLDELLEVLAGGSRGNMELAFSDLRAAIGSEDGYDLSRFVAKVNVFLEDADASDATINRWKEIESFLTGITDTKTLTGLLNDTLTSAKSYADGKVSSGTANMVTMSANAAAADRVLTSAGNNKTAKDSTILISELLRTNLSNVNNTSFASKVLSSGFVPTSAFEATFTSSGVSEISGALEDVRAALNEAAQGERNIMLYDTSGNCVSIVMVSRLTEDSYNCYAIRSSYIYCFNVDLSAINVEIHAVEVYNLAGFLKSIPAATASALGGVKSGGNITVGSDGTVTVNQATKATQDSAGANITSTYLKASAVTDVTDYAEITI